MDTTLPHSPPSKLNKTAIHLTGLLQPTFVGETLKQSEKYQHWDPSVKWGEPHKILAVQKQVDKVPCDKGLFKIEISTARFELVRYPDPTYGRVGRETWLGLSRLGSSRPSPAGTQYTAGRIRSGAFGRNEFGGVRLRSSLQKFLLRSHGNAPLYLPLRCFERIWLISYLRAGTHFFKLYISLAL